MMKDTSPKEGETFDPSKEKAEIFDPFGLGVADTATSGKQEKDDDDDDTSSTRSPKPPPQLKRVGMYDYSPSSDTTSYPIKTSARISSLKSSASSLPPKMVIRLGLHEEVSSLASPNTEGASEVSVDGTVYAQVQSSDALKNVPFVLSGTSSQGESVVFQGNKEIVSTLPLPSTSPSSSSHPQHHLVQIDKSVLNSIAIGSYSISEEIQHMPLLVERKVSVHGNVCRVAVQVRSKLTNLGDLEDFTIAVAVPERVKGSTVKVVHGDGVWDELKRTIKWKVERLPKGSSFMIAAQAQLWSPIAATGDKQTIRFPVLLRCSSSCDKVSSVEFQATEAEGHPAAISCTSFHSFRLLHRLT